MSMIKQSLEAIPVHDVFSVTMLVSSQLLKTKDLASGHILVNLTDSPDDSTTSCRASRVCLANRIVDI
jgi:hypothetical protein